MSFSADTKNELAHVEPEKKCCMLAEIAGFIRMCGSIRLAGGGKFEIVTSDGTSGSGPALQKDAEGILRDRRGTCGGTGKRSEKGPLLSSFHRTGEFE